MVRAATPDWVYLCGPRAAQHILPIPIEQYDIMYTCISITCVSNELLQLVLHFMCVCYSRIPDGGELN